MRQNEHMAAKPRRAAAVADIGGVKIGGNHPIVVQSMTNTDTADVAATVSQVIALIRAGSELVRVTVNTEPAAAAVPEIVERLDNAGAHVPIIGDFHYNGHILLKKYPACAQALAKYRINPGNVNIGKKHDDNFRAMIEAAIRYGKPVRIGVNWGSLDQSLLARMMDENSREPEPREPTAVMLDAMVTSALESARNAERHGLAHDQIVLSAKVSGVEDLVDVYRKLAGAGDYPLHLGLTEAGLGAKGIVASTAAIAILLQEGIGDTIRVALTPAPAGDRTRGGLRLPADSAIAGTAQFQPPGHVLSGLRAHGQPGFSGAGRAGASLPRQQMPVWRNRYPGVEELKVAVMGCIVNGPGESKHSQIAISLPGASEEPAAPVYADGCLSTTLRGENIAGKSEEILSQYVARRFGR